MPYVKICPRNCQQFERKDIPQALAESSDRRGLDLGASGGVTSDVAYAAPEASDIGFDLVASNLATADSDRNLSWVNALPGE